MILRRRRDLQLVIEALTHSKPAAGSVVPPRRRVIILSYLDYPFPAGLSRRITGIVESMRAANFEADIISPLFRSIDMLDDPRAVKVRMRFLRILGTERLPTKILALALFNLFAFVKVFVSRKEILALQYESIYSFPAAFLAKIFCRCFCIGDDVLIPRKSPFSAFFAFILSSASDLVLSSVKLPLGRLPRIRVVYLPTGIEKGMAMERTSITFRNVRVVFVGALSYRANMLAVNHILNASSALPDGYDVEFLVIGSPRPRAVSSNGRVRFLGELDDISLLQVYRDSNVGILPFFGIPAEGPKVKLLEYMAAGLLVMASPEGVQGYPDLVAWEHYIPVGSVEELKQALMIIQRKPDLYSAIAKRGHEFVMAHYQWSVLLRETLTFMETLRHGWRGEQTLAR